MLWFCILRRLVVSFRDEFRNIIIVSLFDKQFLERIFQIIFVVSTFKTWAYLYISCYTSVHEYDPYSLHTYIYICPGRRMSINTI